MKKVILLSIVVFSLIAGGYLLYSLKINKAKKENRTNLSLEDLYTKELQPKDLNPKSFIALFKAKYKGDSKLNLVTMSGEFPDKWVKPNNVEYLISILNSKEKCCGYMNIFSSTISTDNAEVGGFAILFLNSYISKTKINMGLNCNPKTDEESVAKIEKWYQNQLIKIKSTY